MEKENVFIPLHYNEATLTNTTLLFGCASKFKQTEENTENKMHVSDSV